MRQALTRTSLAAVLAVAANPAAAQGEDEPQITWRINMIDVADGGLDRWQEIIVNHLLPAYETAGLEPPQLHRGVDSEEWDMMIIHEEHGGMESLDEAIAADIATVSAAMVEREGSQEAVDALFAELQTLEVKYETTVTQPR